MGKKRRGPTLDEVMARPWCYYCERDFDDLKILISHQKAKHFKCERCGRRLNTAGGLSVHMSQVHKEQLTEVENALPNRAGLEVEIFGMEGMPDDVLMAHQQRVAAQFHQAEVERQAATGNPPAGVSAGGQPAKRPKLENPSDLKKRLAEHRAKRQEAIAGGSSGEGTPIGAGQAAPSPGGYFENRDNHLKPRPCPHPFSNIPTNRPLARYTRPSHRPVLPASLRRLVMERHLHPFPQQQPPPVQIQSPPNSSAFPPRPGSLPPASNLPQRPAFGAPTVNAQQMQQLHMGQTIPSGYANGDVAHKPEVSSSVDALVSGAATEAAAAKTAESTEKPAKKDKSKQTRMIYSDETISPEEKMARLPRYSFVPNRKNTVLGELPAAVVTGAIRDSDTVIDPTH
ncbi:hypothetical protein N7474_004041 [Penicillium riverlandense]|uniref:uncharacterized protein n=1 Tax=Penicillium riverlandense TaxID=1903569 RepID=UPI002549769F|nr:uncharacterized protein N7474_004041 [Penicillium riverlandense]KAJ5818450.1 hypothetical protein N7474_004041 [Penicillium riverlandense]